MIGSSHNLRSLGLGQGQGQTSLGSRSGSVANPDFFLIFRSKIVSFGAVWSVNLKIWHWQPAFISKRKKRPWPFKPDMPINDAHKAETSFTGFRHVISGTLTKRWR